MLVSCSLAQSTTNWKAFFYFNSTASTTCSSSSVLRVGASYVGLHCTPDACHASTVYPGQHFYTLCFSSAQQVVDNSRGTIGSNNFVIEYGWDTSSTCSGTAKSILATKFASCDPSFNAQTRQYTDSYRFTRGDVNCTSINKILYVGSNTCAIAPNTTTNIVTGVCTATSNTSSTMVVCAGSTMSVAWALLMLAVMALL